MTPNILSRVNSIHCCYLPLLPLFFLYIEDFILAVLISSEIVLPIGFAGSLFESLRYDVKRIGNVLGISSIDTA